MRVLFKLWVDGVMIRNQPAWLFFYTRGKAQGKGFMTEIKEFGVKPGKKNGTVIFFIIRTHYKGPEKR